MASFSPKADRLAKFLQLCLSNALGGIASLRQLGWFELLQDDWPRTEVGRGVQRLASSFVRRLPDGVLLSCFLSAGLSGA
jgi:hypothetical protein